MASSHVSVIAICEGNMLRIRAHPEDAALSWLRMFAWHGWREVRRRHSGNALYVTLDRREVVQT